MDRAVVNEMLAEIADGNALLATCEGGEYAVWADYGTKTSSAPFAGVTQAELDAVLAQHRDKVTVRRLEDNHTSREGCSVDANGRVSDAGFHADILGDDD